MGEILRAAQSYWRKGFSIIPVKTDKKPAISNWKQYQTKGPTAEQLDSLFKEAKGIALVCGYKEIVCFDFDAQNLDKFEHEPYEIVEDFFEPFIDTATQWLNDNQYVIAKSKSGGRHLYICIEGVEYKEIDGNLKLAHIPAISKANGKETNKTFIETRGFGGYVVCPPTEGYEYLHGDLKAEELQPIPLEVYHLLIKLARNFSQVAQEEESFTQERPKERNTPHRLTVIDAFNDKYHPSKFLDKHGYKLKLKGLFVNTYLAPDSISKNAGVRLFHNQEKPMVFSHHASDPLGDGKGHDAFDCFVILEHGSNFDSAFRVARDEFGSNSRDYSFSSNNKADFDRTPSEPEKPWGELSDLPEIRPSAEPLDSRLIPESFKPWLEDISERAAIPIEMPTLAALVAAGAAVGRRIGIYPKRFDDWVVVPNLWGGVVCRAGMLKSPILQEAMKPLNRIAAKAYDDFEAEQEDNEHKQEMIDLEIKSLKKALTKILDDRKSATRVDIENLQDDIAKKQKEINKLKDKTAVRYITQDSTVEKLGELFKENPFGLFLLRDELAGWFRGLDKTGQEGAREFFLETWNGTGDYTSDRIGRGTVRVKTCCLSVFGGIQPGKLKKYINEALTEGDGADGLLQRFQIVIWPEELPEWKNIDRYPNKDARNRVYKVFENLVKLSAESFGLELEEDEIPALHFSDDAQELFDEWRDKLEIRLRGEELKKSPAFASHLSKYRSLMPTLALLFHLIDFADYCVDSDKRITDSEKVSLAAAKKAAALCDYLEEHSKRIYATELGKALVVAEALIYRIENDFIQDNCTVRDIYRCGWTGLKDKDAVLEGLEKLAEYNYVRLEDRDIKGRTSFAVRLHPDFRKKEEKEGEGK